MNEQTVRDLDAGMERQLARVRAEQDRGLPRIGWKVALNAPTIQKQLGIDGWVVGALPAEGSLSEPLVSCREGRPLYLEAEVALRLGTSLPSRITPEEAAETIEGFAPAIEIVDFSLPTKGGLAEISSHSFFHAASWVGGALGGFHTLSPEFPVVRKNGEPVASAIPDFALNDPTAIALGVAALLERYDERLEGGDWIFCGSLIQPVEARPGEHFVVDFGPMGTVEMQVDLDEEPA